MDKMDGPPGGKLNRTGRSEMIARTGAVMVWSSILILLLSLAVFFSYTIANADGVTEDDFQPTEPNTYEARIRVTDIATLNCEIKSADGDFMIEVTVYDEDDDIVESYDERTPVVFTLSLSQAGDYLIVIEIKETGRYIDDLDIMITSNGLDLLVVCCGLFMGGILVFCLFVTGLILLIVAIVKRKRELHPPPKKLRYRSPPPPPYYRPYHEERMYPRAPPMYRDRYGGPDQEPSVYERYDERVYGGRYDKDREGGSW